MKTRDTAAHLARRLVDTTRALGREAAALITDMSQPLGSAVGNTLEGRETIEVLLGRGPADVRDLTLELAAGGRGGAGGGRAPAAGRDPAPRALGSGGGGG